MKNVIRISASDLACSSATASKLNAVVKSNFEAMFSEPNSLGVRGIMASELLEALRNLGEGEAIREESQTTKATDRGKSLFLVCFPSGVSFSGYRLQGQLIICCREYGFAFTQSEVYHVYEDWLKSSSFRCSQPGVRKLSAEQLAALMRDFACGLPSLLGKWEQKLHEARKRASMKKMDVTASKSLITYEMGSTGLTYLMEEQCHRMKLTIQISKMNQIAIYLPYRDAVDSLHKQLPSVIALKSALEGLSKGSVIQGVERGRHWITGSDSTLSNKD